jgi:ATP adenylyltransferase
MDRLWAPWRLPYLKASKEPSADGGCFICAGLAAQEDRANLVAWRRPHSVVVLNRFPYNNGHLLIAPRTHKAALAELSREETLETMDTLSRAIGALDGIMHPDGYNVGLNLGIAAGAGLPGHIHWHLVPRWNGDTNFMPVLGDAKVISQSLESLYDLLAARWSAPGLVEPLR